MPRINQQFSLIEDPPKSSILSPSSPSSRRPQEVSSMESPPMVTRSMCSGECPSDSLTGRGWRKKSGKTTPSAPVDHHYHHEHHSHLHHHYHKSPYMVEPRKGLAEMSDDNDDDMEETQRRITKRRLVGGGGDDDDSSDEEITLIRRTTNKIMTSIEISSRKMNSVHPSFTKLAFISLLLPISVFLFSWYYYDYSPAIFSPFQHQTPQQAALLSSVSSSSLPKSTSPTGQPLPSSPFSPPITPSSNSQSFCNLTSSCPSQEEIVILNKRLDKLEQLVLKLTDENTKGTKFINSVNEKVSILDRENRKNFASIDERFDLIAQKIEDAIEVNIKVARSQETPTVEGIGEMIKQAIYLYDSDKTGKADYALESSGGSIVTSRCSETYDPHGIKYSVWGIPIWFTSNSPRTMIQASMAPGECWAFPGSMGNVTIKLSARIIPTEFSYEHIAKEISRDGNISSAPKAIQIRGLRDENDFDGVLLGNYIYQDNDRPLQHFQVQNNKARPFNYITLIVLSNHGHNEYTCLYRFRVHGHKAE